jgi:hypothetical protein
VAALGIPAFLHYPQFGDREGRLPNPLFDPKYYRSRFKEPPPEDFNALAHFVEHGFKEGRATHVLFDTAYYIRHYRDVVETKANPLQHFLQTGGVELRSPHALVDMRRMVDIDPELAKFNQNPLLGFLGSPSRFWLSPHPLFNVDFYVRQEPEAKQWGEGPFAHFLRFGKQRDPTPLFHSRYYLTQCSEPEDIACPLAHYLESSPPRISQSASVVRYEVLSRTLSRRRGKEAATRWCTSLCMEEPFGNAVSHMPCSIHDSTPSN